MRKSISVVTVALTFILAALVGATPAQADGVDVSVSGATATFTINGIYASNVPVTSFSSPNAAYSLTFTLATSPTPDFVDTSAGVFGMNATVAINGVDFASSEILFFNTDNQNVGGLVVCVSTTCDSDSLSTFWDIAGSQLFTGNVDNPAFFSGAMTVDRVVSGYQINGLPGSDSSFPFPNLVTQSPVPEPASLFLMGLGLLGIGVLARRKTKAR